MNSKRLALAIPAVFVAVWITDFLIHGVWLRSDYQASMSLWRTDAEMKAHMAWVFLGQLLWAVPFVMIWARGFAPTGSLSCAVRYGMMMGVFFQASTLVSYAVQPLPGALAVKWFVSGVAQGVLMGVIVFYVYKPTPADALPESPKA